MLRTHVILPAVALSLIGTPALAELEQVDRETETIGATTITWDSAFEDTDYTVGAEILMRVDWEVVDGFAAFIDFVLRGPQFTPKGPDPATGQLLDVELTQRSGGEGTSGQVEVLFLFNQLHCEPDLELELGNAHFSLVLDIDTDGDGRADSEVEYGVNVHVEEPGAC